MTQKEWEKLVEKAEVLAKETGESTRKCLFWLLPKWKKRKRKKQ